MSLKAGRVGVNPTDVDPVSGHVNPAAVDSYTKSQADDKFLAKSDASSTYETKSDAAALQPITLAVPITMLSGTKLTVETALNGLQTDKVDLTYYEDTVGSIPEGATVSTNHIVKQGYIKSLFFELSGVTCDAWTNIGVIPAGYRPRYQITCKDGRESPVYQIKDNGNITVVGALNNAAVRIYITFI